MDPAQGQFNCKHLRICTYKNKPKPSHDCTDSLPSPKIQFSLFAFPHQRKVVFNTANSHSPRLFLEGNGGSYKRGSGGRGMRKTNQWKTPAGLQTRFNWRKGDVLSVTTRWRSQPSPPSRNPVQIILGVRTVSPSMFPGEFSPNQEHWPTHLHSRLICKRTTIRKVAARQCRAKFHKQLNPPCPSPTHTPLQETDHLLDLSKCTTKP